MPPSSSALLWKHLLLVFTLKLKRENVHAQLIDMFSNDLNPPHLSLLVCWSKMRVNTFTLCRLSVKTEEEEKISSSLKLIQVEALTHIQSPKP